MHNFVPSFDPDGSPPAGALAPTPAHAVAVKQWTRDFLRLGDDAVVTVIELACADPRCPLVETVIAVFEEGRTRQWKFTRPKAAITKVMVQQALTASGLPPALNAPDRRSA